MRCIGREINKWLFAIIILFKEWLNSYYKSIKKRHFTLLNTKIKVHSYNYLRKKFDLDVLIEDAQLFKDEKIEASLKSSLSYFIIEEKAINVHKGKNSTFNKIELLRSIINFTYQYRILHFSNYEPKPLSLIYPPKAFFAFDSNQKYLENWKTVYPYDSQEIDFANGNLRNKEVIKRAEKHIKKINSINKGNFRNLIITTFYLHNYGLDHHYKPFSSFLNFWQIFELISLNSKQEYVSKRMLSLLKPRFPTQINKPALCDIVPFKLWLIFGRNSQHFNNNFA